jgi:predicted glycosyltransferase involved in capsule biosynthesis
MRIAYHYNKKYTWELWFDQKNMCINILTLSSNLTKDIPEDRFILQSYIIAVQLLSNDCYLETGTHDHIDTREK